jgi:hypothetical protein
MEQEFNPGLLLFDYAIRVRNFNWRPNLEAAPRIKL